MDTISYVYLIYVSTIKFHVNINIPIHYYCILTLCYQFYHLLYIRYKPGIQAQDNADLVKLVLIFSYVPGSIWGIIWVHTFHLAIACVRLGGSLTPPFLSYLKIAWGASFSG